MARLRYRAPWFEAQTATRVRLFTREGDALAAATKLEERGYSTEVSTAERTPWEIRRRAPWST